MVEQDLHTFLDFFKFLQSYDGDILTWLEKPWVGKDKQGHC